MVRGKHMSAEHTISNNGGNDTTPQELQAILIRDAVFDSAVTSIVDGVHQGNSPSMLSVLQPDLLEGFAQAWLQKSDEIEEVETAPSYKDELYDLHESAATEGDPAAILALPKFATTLGRLTLAMELVVTHKDAVAAWQGDRAYLQYLGTFDPQHVGHRIGVQSALITAGENSSVIAHVMDGHPRKSDFRSPYGVRYREAEQRFYASEFIDNTRLTQIDIPGGVGLANVGLEQMKLLADLCGDQELRWVIGSDKLLLDADAIRMGRAPSKASLRFSDPRMHAYVIHRQFDDRTRLEGTVDYVTDSFGTAITLVDELPYDCAPASSTRVKELRALGRDVEADHMELYELLS